MQRFKVTEPLFNIDVFVILGTPEDGRAECKQRLHESAEPLVADGFLRWYLDNDVCGKQFVLFINQDATDLVDTVLHEVSHLVDWILERNDIPTDRKSSTELRARLVGYYGTQILRKLI